LVLLAWHPLALELCLGQLSLCLLPLFLLAWLALRQGREAVGGLWLGALVILKMAGVPILLWLAWRRRWRAIGAAAALWTAAHLLAISLHGWPLVRDYYLKVGPQVSAIYRLSFANLSVWTLGQRLFGEMNWKFVSVPLWAAPGLVKLLTVLAPLILLVALVWAAERARRFETAFTLLMGVGLFLTPVAWEHYFVLALPAFYLLFQRLAKLEWPRWPTGLACLSVAAISISEGVYFEAVKHFFQGTTAAGLPLVGALPALLTLIPLLAVGVLLGQMVALERPLEETPASVKLAVDWQATPAGETVLASN
jgi:hypothetical protein